MTPQELAIAVAKWEAVGLTTDLLLQAQKETCAASCEGIITESGVTFTEFPEVFPLIFPLTKELVKLGITPDPVWLLRDFVLWMRTNRMTNDNMEPDEILSLVGSYVLVYPVRVAALDIPDLGLT